MTAAKGTSIGSGRHVNAPPAWNGFGRIPIGWYDASPPGSYHAQHGLIRWDAWWVGSVAAGVGNFGTVRANFPHRQPSDYAASFYSCDPTLSTITLPQEQAIEDAVIQKCAAAGFGYFAFDWYPYASMQVPGEEGHENLMRGWQRYQASAYKNQISWCWIVQDAWLQDGANVATRLAWIASSVDSMHLHHGARPVVFLFWTGSALTPWSAALVTQLRNAFKAAGKGNPYLIGQGTTNTGWKNFGVDARTGYGPLDCVPAGGTGAHVAWSAVDTKVQSVTWFVDALLNSVPHLMPQSDPRALGLAAPWADAATTSQWVSHIKAAETFIAANPTTCPANLTLTYALNEMSELGGVLPTAQNDALGTGRGQWLDGMAHVTGLVPRTTLWNGYTPLSGIPGVIAYAVPANWSNTLAVAGAFESSILFSSTTSETITFTVTTAAAGVIRVYGRKGPAQGIASFTVDGGAPSNVDCYAAALSEHQLLFEVTGLSAASHAVVCTVTGTKNASSSANTITLDEFRALVVAP